MKQLSRIDPRPDHAADQCPASIARPVTRAPLAPTIFCPGSDVRRCVESMQAQAAAT